MSTCTCAMKGPASCPRHRAYTDNRYDHGVGPAPHTYQIPAYQPPALPYEQAAGDTDDTQVNT